MSTPRDVRRRQIGPIGTTARGVIGGLLLCSARSVAHSSTSTAIGNWA